MNFIKSLLVLFCLQTTLFAQNNFWKKSDESRIPSSLKTQRQIIPQLYKVVELDFDALKKTLANAPKRFAQNAQNQSVVIEIPFPDGSFQQFRVEEASVMHDDLQAKYPSIRSFAAYGVTNRYNTMRCEYSENGFSAMIFCPEATYFIDTYAKNNTNFYVVYDKKDFTTDKKMDCGFINSPDNEEINHADEDRTGDGMLRTYRLALACTAEYGTFCGGTVPKVMAAFNKSMTRVNGIYEREFSITMKIVPKNDTLIFFNATTDPYTNTSGSTMLGQNQTTCTQRIGSANFDIGHVFSTGGGGVAQPQGPCNNSNKARGVTGSSSPVNDPFDVDYVAHEMGHQFSADHTFNNSCSNNVASGSAYEPGSGSTIMAYAGICSPNVQNNSDAYFHVQSIIQINAYSVTGGGNACPQKTSTGNTNQPTASAGADYQIPRNTPFELIGSGSDADNDPITYCWEQFDRETAPQAPKATNTSGPAFRSLFPKISNTRVFPNIDNIVKNTNNTWEVLAGVNRKYNFRVTTRDNHNGFGRANFDQMTINVNASAGPFLVTAPNTAVSWEVLTNQTVTWNVATTDVAPVNTPLVDILLSTDGGYTYPDTIATKVPNNGSYTIKVPNKASKTARIKVKGSGNIFFDISNANFEIKLPPAPIFVMDPTVQNIGVCKTQKDSASFDVVFTALAGFKENVKITTKNVPTGAKITLSADTLTPNATIKVILYDLKNATNGVFPMQIVGTSATKKDSVTIPTSIFDGIPAVAKLLSPLDFKGISLKNDVLKWKKTANTNRYVLEISKDFLFKNIDETANVSDTFFSPTKLQLASVYFWRVKAKNTCADADFSQTGAFQTMEQVCNDFSPTTLPLVIPDNALFNQNLDISVAGMKKVSSIEAKLTVTHSYVSDLIVTLESPDAKKAVLVSNQCTSNDNIDATFTDAGVALLCTNLPAVKGNVKPKDAFSIFKGISANGLWKLNIQDDDETGSGGAANIVNLKVCSEDTVDVVMDLVKNEFKVVEGTNKAVSNQFLSVTSPNVLPSDITLLITKLPTQGTLRRGSTPLVLGATITMQELNSGAFLYFNNTGSAAKDSFQFMAFTTTKGWLTTSTFPITILTGAALTINAAQTKNISCFNSNDAQISIDIIGGQKPYQYSIDGGTNFKDTSIFYNITAGKYFPTVKDAQGIIKKGDTITVKNPSLLLVTATKDSNNVYITVNGGTKPYLINFNNKGFSKVDTFKFLSNGKYPILVKDANDCSATDTASIFVNTIVAGAIVNKTIKCNGEKTGEIKVNTFGGKAPLQYQLNSAAFQNTPTFSNLSAGDYTVTVKDADGFLKTTPKVTLTNPDSIVAKQLIVFKDSLFVDGAGGTGFLQYSTGGAFTDKNTFGGLANGNYTLTIKDGNACTKSYPFSINVGVATFDLIENLGVSIAPNPTSDILTIRFNTATENDIDLIVNDLQGRLILKNTISSHTNLYRLNLSDLPNATYQLLLKNGEKIGVVKLVVLR